MWLVNLTVSSEGIAVNWLRETRGMRRAWILAPRRMVDGAITGFEHFRKLSSDGGGVAMITRPLPWFASFIRSVPT